MRTIKLTEFEGCTDHLYDVIFQESVNYLSGLDQEGTSDWE
jgi:hypothetical protein